MRKMVEIEYVGIEDVQEILDDARAVMSVGHYVNVSIGNVGELPLVTVNIILDGFVSSASLIIHIRFICQTKKARLH